MEQRLCLGRHPPSPQSPLLCAYRRRRRGWTTRFERYIADLGDAEAGCLPERTLQEKPDQASLCRGGTPAPTLQPLSPRDNPDGGGRGWRLDMQMRHVLPAGARRPLRLRAASRVAPCPSWEVPAFPPQPLSSLSGPLFPALPPW